MKTPKINIGRLLKQIDSFSQDAKRMAVGVTNVTADDIVADAKNKAPADLGQLRLSIKNTEATIQLNRSLIYSNALYSPFVEFGTGGEVSIPKGFEDLASRFKGKGIKKIDIKPQPYFIPAYLQNIPIYQKKLIKTLERETKKYNAKK